MKKILFLFSILMFLCFSIQAQEEVVASDDDDKTPVLDPWSSGYLIDNPTVVQLTQKQLGLNIAHRFSKIEDMEDLLGIYGPSNIQLQLCYGITNRIQLGFATEKNNKLQVLDGKVALLQQSRSGKIPLSISFYGNVGIDSRDVNFESFTNRLSYHAEFIFARKFSDRLSFQIAPGFSHINDVDSIYLWDAINISVGGRFKVYNEMSLIMEYDQGFNIQTKRDWTVDTKPNLGFGLEIGTSTHTFQFFVAPFDHIVAQKNYTANTNDFTDGGMRFGFNITVKF